MRIIITVYLFFSAVFSTAQTFSEKFKLPTALYESSGLIMLKDSTLVSINDSGNEPILFFLDFNGTIQRQVFVTNGNTDWEAITTDANQQYLYIGDFGNNRNSRVNLKILRLEMSQVLELDTVTAAEISFSYPQQSTFPPTPNSLFFDAEALIVWNQELYIFTKNRKEPFDGRSLVYKLPTRPGNFSAQLVDSLMFPGFRFTNWITDAALHPSKSRLALLAGNRVFLFFDFPQNEFSNGAFFEWELPISMQFEGITWATTEKLLVSCESSKLGDAALFELDISVLVTYHDSSRRAEVVIPEKIFKDSVSIALNLTVAANVYYELFDVQGLRMAYGKLGFYPKGSSTNSFLPNSTLIRNGSYLLNVIVGDRPHGFFVMRHHPDEVLKALEELKNHIKK